MSNRSTTRRRAQPPPPPAPDRRKVFAIAAAAVVVVVVVGVIIALAGGGKDGDGNGGSNDSQASVKPVFGPVTVTGDALAAFSPDGADPASGEAAPKVEGVTLERTPISIGEPGKPTFIAFLAHWCPHCQRELPVLVKLADEGAFKDVRLVAVLTGTDAKAPNFPPAAWLDKEGWSGEVLLDDEGFKAANSFGLKGYPFLVTLDAEGRVVSRTSGEVPEEGIIDMIESAKGG